MIVWIVLIAVVAAAAFIWTQLGDRAAARREADPIRRIDLGTNALAAQQAEADLTEAGLTVRIVTMEHGAFGAGMGLQHFLVYNVEDHDQVQAVVDALLD